MYTEFEHLFCVIHMKNSLNSLDLQHTAMCGMGVRDEVENLGQG